MSEPKKVLVNHPDGRICEIPVEVLDKHVVPPERVKELARRAAEAAGIGGPEPGADPHEGAGAKHSVVVPPSGQNVVFNFYLGPQARLSMHQEGAGAATASDVEGYHLDLDAFGSMSVHSDWRVGPFIDKTGRPSFGPHSHDPGTGNAQ